MTRKQRHQLQQKLFKALMFQAESMRKQSFMTDVVLKCQGRKYVAHSLILSSVSPFFKKQINALEYKKTVHLNLDFINNKVLEDVLQFCYTGRLHLKNKTQLHLKELTETSILLEIPLLSKHCLRLLLGGSSGDDLINNWKLIEELNSETIRRIFLEDILSNLSILKTNEEFLALDAAQFDSIFHSWKIHSCSRDEIVESVILWVKHNAKAREKYLNKYLNNVDFDKISPSLLVKLHQEPLLENNIAFLNAYKSAFTRLVTFKKVTFSTRSEHKNLAESSKSSLEGPKRLQTKKKLETTTPDINKSREVACVKYEQTQHQSLPPNAQCFNTSRTPDATEVAMSLPNNTTSHLDASSTELSTVSQNRKFFVYSCDDSDNPKLYQGNCRTDITVSNLTEMVNHPLINTKFPTFCSYKRHLFSFGGYCLKTKQYLSSCYAYDTLSQQWYKRKDMREALCFATAVELKGFIYIVGGISTVNSVWCYDPAGDSWESVSSLPTISHVSHRTLVTATDTNLLAVINRYIYKYNPKDGLWVPTKQCLPKPMHMIAIENRLYIIESKTKSKYIWIYDMDNKCFDRRAIGVQLSSCRGMFNMKNAKAAEMLVIGEKHWFLYRPPDSWELVDRMKLCEGQIVNNNIDVEVVVGFG